MRNILLTVALVAAIALAPMVADAPQERRPEIRASAGMACATLFGCLLTCEIGFMLLMWDMPSRIRKKWVAFIKHKNAENAR